MHIRNFNLMTIFTTFAAVLMLAVSLPVCSQELANQDTLVANDSLAVDTIVNNDPEWYVAPMTHDLARAPRLAAGACPIDSVRTFNVDSVLESVSVYEYGDTTRTMIWTVNPDGSRFGSGREESASTASSTYSATYAWDFTTNDWAGTSREEHYFVGGKDTAWLVYAWVDNAWVVNTKYTYVYDASGRETEFTTYERNASGQLAYSKQRIREYNTAGRTTLDIQYTAHNGTDWSAGTKELWEFNASSLQTLHEKYTLANSDWTITLREIKGYDAANNNDLIENYALQSNVWKGTKKEEYIFNSARKKTSSIVYAWSNDAWVNSTKEIWEFNGPSAKQTLHEKYSWTNNDWQITLQENTGFTGNNNTLIENYTYTNGVQKGSKKEEYTYSGSTRIATITYTWSNNEWVYNVWTVSDKVSNPNESCRYVWTNDAWVGNGNRTLTTNSSNKPIEVITQTWSTEVADWLNYTRKTTVYEGSKTTQEATYNWSVEANDWVGATRSDWHYNAQGKNDTIKTYTNNGAEWIYSSRKVTTYYSDGAEKMVHNAQWSTENAKWVMTSMTRTDIGDVTEGGIRQTLNASWRCGADSVWIGQTKDSTAYTASGKTLYKIHCQAWANNDWVPQYKIEYEYDESERKILEQRFNWNVNVNAWRGDYRHEFGFDEYGHQNMKASYVSWNVSTNSWIGNTKTEDIYGSNGQVSTSILFIWGADAWKPLFRTVYTYDSNSTPREIKRTIEQYSNEDWVYTEQYIKEYDGSIQIKDNSYVWLNSQWMFTSRDETYYDDDSQAKIRRQVTGLWSNGNLLSFSDEQYYYACDPKLAFTIRFENEDGTLLQSKQVNSGEVPEYTGETPTKDGNEQYSYTFKGWDKTIVPATADATYTATYNTVVNTYLITFTNGDVTLQSGQVAYGAVPTYDGETPTKDGNEQYTYSFKGWDAELAAVTGAATYNAVFDTTVNTYLITFMNGETVLQSTEVEYGVAPVYTGEMPSRPATTEFTYSFKGWDAELAAVTGAATYNAVFETTVNTYLITFKNGDNVLQSGQVAYGAVPVYNGEAPTKDSNEQYTYSFKGWDAELAEVTGEATYNATFSNTLNKYLITFKNGDETLQSTEVEYGVAPVYTGEMPSRPATAEFTYSFKGWDKAIASVTGAATYNAVFETTVNTYLITFMNGETVLQSTEVEYGVAPVYTGEMPSRPATAEFTYSFKGWDAELAAVTGAATYNAVFETTVNTYLITFMNGETVLQSTEVEYGVAPVYTGEMPSRPATAEFTYSFVGWDAELAAVTGAATYNAVFETTVNTYLITFMNGETVLQSGQVAYGTVPTYDGETPTKDGNEQYTYSFKGWDAELAAVTGAATYNAVFEEVVNRYAVTWLNGDGSVIRCDSVEYGVAPVYIGEMPSRPATAEFSYTFIGWDKAIMPVTGDAVYTAQYESVRNSYTITFYFDDGVTVMESVVVAYGETPATSFTPSKIAEEHYYYHFIGWTPAVVPVTGEASYTAIFDTIPQEYLITFKNYNGTVLQKTNVPYGTMPEYTGATPTKPRTQQYSYEFAGWSPELTEVEGETTYTALFDAVLNQYTVVFLDEDGTELDRQIVDYGTTPVYQGETPVKAEDEQYTYTFEGWYPAVTAVTKDATYYATYTSHDKSQGVWDVQDGAAPSTKILRNGTLYILRAGKTYTTDGVLVED